MHYVKKMEYQFKMRKGKDTMNLIINLRWMEYICDSLSFSFLVKTGKKKNKQHKQKIRFRGHRALLSYHTSFL